MGSCAAPSAKGDDKFITTDYLQQCPVRILPDIGVQGDVLKRGVRNFRFVSLQRLTIRKTHRASNETAIYSYQDYQYHIFEKAVSVMKEKTHRGSSIGWQDPGIGLRFRLVQHQYNLLISPRQK